MFSRKTKIVCSQGPATSTDKIVEDMILAGMNVARFNFSHGDHQEHLERIERVRRCSQKLGRPVALMMDTKGPEIRTGNVLDGKKVTIKSGETVIVTVDDAFVTASTDNQPAHISLNWKALPKKVSKGVKILIADGLLELNVEHTDGITVTCKATNTAEIGSKKNVNLIGIHAGLPIMSEQDKKDIEFGAKVGLDFVAASFVSFASEIHEIRNFLDNLNSPMKIIAKIENEEGLDNIEEIVQAADGVMVARGDLGVQLPTERIPLAQKRIIAECRKAGKPVITATQMLESMIQNPRPTRAELTDVANAIFDGTDAVMLSGETANGKYPVEAVATMDRIAKTVEDSPDYCERIKSALPELGNGGTIGKIMARMAYMTADQVKAMCIVVPTLSGNTAKMISIFRPEQAVLAVTTDPRVQRQLLLNWGIVPLITKIADDSEEMVHNAVKLALDNGAVHLSDRIVLCAGIPLVSPLMVNTVRVLLVGNVIARGRRGGCNPDFHRVSGRIVRANTPEDAFMALRSKHGEILLCPKITDDWIPILRVVDGAIIEGECEISSDIMALINPRLVWISNAGASTKTFETGLTVTIDGVEMLVYEGVI